MYDDDKELKRFCKIYDTIAFILTWAIVSVIVYYFTDLADMVLGIVLLIPIGVVSIIVSVLVGLWLTIIGRSL